MQDSGDVEALPDSADGADGADGSTPDANGGTPNQPDIPDESLVDAGTQPDASDGTHDGGNAQDGQAPDGSEPAPTGLHWTAGHGDLALAYRSSDDVLQASFRLGGATLDGVAVDGERSVDDVLVHSSATFARPNPDNGFFAPLCVELGEEVQWLPQRNQDATAAGAPFVGLLAAIEPGVLVDDQLTLELSAVRSPSGTGAYSLWRDGFPPTFYFTSCDGIGAEDTLTLPIGHDHFNMGFSEPGLWEVDYRVTAQLAADASTRSADVTVRYLLD